MRFIVILLTVSVCCSCARLPTHVPQASSQQLKAVVFDVDGTLTPTPAAIWAARADAANVVRLYAERGYKIIYLSARIAPFQYTLPGWLTDNGFPEGSINVPQTRGDELDPAPFKLAVLEQYLANGWAIEYAYGDSSTDFTAYSAAGLARERIYALRRQGEPACQPGVWARCLNGWTEHLNAIRKALLPADG